jgi:hypothetical protein
VQFEVQFDTAQWRLVQLVWFSFVWHSLMEFGAGWCSVWFSLVQFSVCGAAEIAKVVK